MKSNNGLREILMQMSTEQLDELLQKELQKKPPDSLAVKLIMEVLEERDSSEPLEVDDVARAAWEEYKQSITETQTLRLSWRWGGTLLRVASVLLVLGMLLCVIPQEADAQSLWERFLHVTDSVFEFFDPGEKNDHRVAYKFETDNPGLQQVYDAVVELGITDPVVPMWLPEGYELEELKEECTPTKVEAHIRFVHADNYVVLKYEIYNESVTHRYYKDDSTCKTIEYGGITHNVMQNNDMLVAIWTRDNVECFLTVECQEDILYEILKSIYVMGDE